MHILLTGGAGDLGQALAQKLINQGDQPHILDVAPSKLNVPQTQGSIIDRPTVTLAMQGMDMVVHIAAWHGIHEAQGKTAFDFHDLNVTGTLNLLETAAQQGVKRFVLISSTSVDDRFGLYGHTKVLNEEMARAYAHRHGMNILTLRPRAFVPHWNRAVYPDFVSWAKWFWKGAVHLDDVTLATLLAINYLKTNTPPEPAPTLTIDGAYDYTADDINTWDAQGPGTTFRRVYGDALANLATQHGLDITRAPKILGNPETTALLGYQATYSLKNLLAELNHNAA